MKKIILLFTLIFIPLAPAFAENLELYTNQKIYSSKQPLFVYGTAQPNETVILRLFAPDGTIAKFDQLSTENDGSFRHLLMDWPKSSTSLPYGTYTVEIISQSQNGLSKTVDIKFSSTSELFSVPVERHVNTLVFAPETAAVNQPFRIFVQVSSDGLLVGDDPKNILGTSHVHFSDGQVESLSVDLKMLHEGLYYVDYIAKKQGTYVFHMVSFNQGTISHGSAATQVLSQDIGGMSKQILELNTVLSETSNELGVLKNEIGGFGSSLKSANERIDSSVSKIDSSVDAIHNSVSTIEDASLQLNALLFPVVASICVILALQIVILARRR